MIGRKVWFPSDGPKGKIHIFSLKYHYRFILEPSGLGSHYGTLSGPIGHFSAESKPNFMHTMQRLNNIYVIHLKPKVKVKVTGEKCK